MLLKHNLKSLSIKNGVISSYKMSQQLEISDITARKLWANPYHHLTGSIILSAARRFRVWDLKQIVDFEMDSTEASLEFNDLKPATFETMTQP